MKKFKIIFLADNNSYNVIINNIIKDLNFKFLEVEILYTQFTNIKKRSFLFNLLIKFIFFIEKKFLFKIENIRYKKNTIIKKRNISLISSHNFLLENKNNSDLIIDLSNHNLPNKIISIYKYGLWYIDYGVKSNFFLGFKECLLNYKIVNTFLLEKKFKNKKIITSCIDKHHLNNKINFWLRNKEFITFKSSNLFTKNLNKISYNLKISSIKYLKNKEDTVIKFNNLLDYIFIKYFIYILTILFHKIKNQQSNVWKIYFLNSNVGDFLSNKNIYKDSHLINPSYSHEYADPFIYNHKEVDYIFFENNNLKSDKGNISYGILTDEKLTYIQDTFNFKYHLSYPFLWKSKKDIFLIPESSENKLVQIWKCEKFPNKWKLHKTIFKNEYCCDTTIIKDFNNNNWLLTNKSNDPTNDASNELYIYKIIGDFDKFIPHKLNPVITDCRIARNAGKLDINNKILRPSQINDSSGYGVGLNINEIVSLNLETFKERVIKKIYPNKKTNATGIHHISNTNSKIVFDVREKSNI